ncbi:hypothetical protein [Maricaulis sp.]|uniref:hypothetical protein n=1 Tax=Maricaulis sp. TaxID=1486257 RepID=UPI003A90DC5F
MDIDQKKLAAKFKAISRTGRSDSATKNAELEARINQELPGIEAGDIKIIYMSPELKKELGYDADSDDG